MGKKDGEPFESWAEAETVISEALDRWRKVQDEAEAAYQALVAIRQRVSLTQIAERLKKA